MRAEKIAARAPFYYLCELLKPNAAPPEPPLRWKWTFCHLLSLLCQTRLSSDWWVCAWPCLEIFCVWKICENKILRLLTCPCTGWVGRRRCKRHLHQVNGHEDWVWSCLRLCSSFLILKRDVCLKIWIKPNLLFSRIFLYSTKVNFILKTWAIIIGFKLFLYQNYFLLYIQFLFK